MFRANLMHALVKQGWQVVACAPEARPETIKQVRELGATFRDLRIERAGMNPLADVAGYFVMRRLLSEERPDIFFAYTIKPVVFGSFAAKRAGVPRRCAMITGLGYGLIGTSPARRALARLVKAMYRRALRHYQTVIFQNTDDRDLFVNGKLTHPSNRIVLVNGSGVDLQRFREAPPPPGNTVFILVARLLREKGVVEFVEAAREVKKKHPQARFRLVGALDKNPASIGAGLLAAWEAEGVVEYAGWLPDVRGELASSSVFVLPSYREGTPHSTLEALATGRPVITTDTPGCRETVQDGHNGFLVPVKNAPELARAMERFIGAGDLIATMGHRSRLLAEEKFDVEKVNEVMLDALGISKAPEAKPGGP